MPRLKQIKRKPRASPSLSATSVAVGTKKKGGDGRMWICSAYTREGKTVKKWTPVAGAFTTAKKNTTKKKTTKKKTTKKKTTKKKSPAKKKTTKKKTPAKKKTTKKKSPAKKKTTKKKTPAKKKTTKKKSPAKKKTTKKKTPAKKKTTKKKTVSKSKRKSPSKSANSVKVGTKMRGGDGKMWVCKSYRWVSKRVGVNYGQKITVKRWVRA